MTSVAGLNNFNTIKISNLLLILLKLVSQRDSASFPLGWEQISNLLDATKRRAISEKLEHRAGRTRTQTCVSF